MPDPSKVNKQEIQRNRPKRQTPRESNVPLQSAGVVPFNPGLTSPWITAITAQKAIEQLLLLAISQNEKIVTVTDHYTVLSDDSVILVDASLRPIVITLLPGSVVTPPQGKGITVTKVDSSSNTVKLITADGSLILGEESIEICFQYTSGSFITDGVSYTAR